MGWEDQKGKVANIVKIGDKEGQQRSAEGVFVGVTGGQYGILYDFIGKGGKRFAIPNNADLEAKLSPDDHIGKLVQVEFVEWKSIKGGKTVKVLAVRIYGGAPTPEMVADYPMLASQEEKLEDFPEALDDEDDDLPF